MGQQVILLVEDDHEMRSLLRDELGDLGYPLREARGVDEALGYLREALPALILTDLRMPDGGFDYVARLRRSAPTCPIVVMTSFGDEGTKTDVLKRGAAAFFDKPVRLADVKATIVRLLGNHQGVGDSTVKNSDWGN